jgi:transposase-like protein
MVQRLSGPGRLSASRLAEEVGISQPTLSRWLRDATQLGKEGKKDVKRREDLQAATVSPKDLPPAEKLRLVIEAAVLSDDELGAFLRRHGLHEAQLQEWRQMVEEAALGALEKPGKRKPRQSPERKRIRDLERELNRKDKALAEVTALLALKKKLDALLGAEDDDTSARSER